MDKEASRVVQNDQYGTRVERMRFYNYREIPENKLVELSNKYPSLLEYSEIKHMRTKRLSARLLDATALKARQIPQMSETKKKSETLDEQKCASIKKISVGSNSTRAQNCKKYSFIKL